jgi:hypothetical protein
MKTKYIKSMDKMSDGSYWEYVPSGGWRESSEGEMLGRSGRSLVRILQEDAIAAWDKFRKRKVKRGPARGA